MSKRILAMMMTIYMVVPAMSLLSGCSGGGYSSENGGKVEQNISCDKEYTVGKSSKTGWQLSIPENTFDNDEVLTMNVLSEEESGNYQNDAFDFIGSPVKIAVGEEDSVRLNTSVTVTMRLPKGLDISKEQIDDYVVAYYTGEDWDYIFPDIKQLTKGYVTFETYHFSLFATVELTEEEKIKLYAKKMALQSWEAEDKEKALSDKIESMFTEAFEKMGISDSSMQGKLFRSLAKENDFGALIVSAERGDLADYSVKCGEMAANAIIKHLSLEEALMDKLTEKGAAVATGLTKAALQVYDGNYEDAAKELSSAFIGYFPAGRAYQATVEIIDAGISSWKDYECEAAYLSYTGFAGNGAYGYKIQSGDWDTLCIQMRGYLTRVQDEAKNTYCAVNKISRSELDKDKALSQQIADNAESNIRTQFEKRLANQENIKSKEAEYGEIIEGFKNSLLLERGTFGFDFDMDIQDRLRTLFSIRKNLLEMFDGEMPVLSTGESAEANLNEAIAQWLACGTKNRGAFYKWLEEKGYKSKVKLAGGGFAWVLVDVEDFSNDEKWEVANEHVSYKYEYSYSQGSYSAKTIYEGESDDYYNPPCIKGEALGVQAVFGGIPEVIYADTPVNLTLSFSVTENSQSYFTFSASANATFDEPGIEAGYGTGGSISFVNGDGKANFDESINTDYASINDTLTAQLSAGNPGDRIALCTSMYMSIPMCTNYVYEWKEQ